MKILSLITTGLFLIFLCACSEEDVDASAHTVETDFIIGRGQLEMLEARKDILVKRLNRYQEVFTTDPSLFEDAVVTEIEQEIELVKEAIVEMQEPIWRSGSQPPSELLIKLRYQQAEEDYRTNRTGLIKLGEDQRHIRFLLKVPFEPAKVRQSAR